MIATERTRLGQALHRCLRVGKALLALLLILGSTIEPFEAQAQINYATPASSYSQDFDGILSPVPANNTTQSTPALPTGWVFVESGSNANTSYRVHDGTGTTGDTYLYGATTSAERALGCLASGSLTSRFGANFTNSTGTTLTEFTLSYTGEQWKDGRGTTAVQNTLTFDYAINATNLTTGTYQPVTALDFAAPVGGANPQTGSDIALNGNLAVNQASISFTLTGINWTPGSTLWIRWSDFNDASNDDALAIDNVTFTADGAPPSEDPVVNTTSLGAFGAVCQDVEVGPNTFVVSGSNLTGNVNVGPYTGFTFSTDDITYSGSLTLSPDVNDAISQTVFVKFLPITAPTDFSGDIPVNGGGAPDADVSVVASSLPVGLATLISGGRVSLSGNLLTLFGRLVDVNCATVSEYGIEWSTTEGFTPGTGTQVASSNWASTTTGLFSAVVDISSLCVGSSLYFRAYAVNSAGTAHGAEVAYGLQRSAISQWTFDLAETTPSTGTGTAALIGGTTATFAGGNPGQAWNVAGFPAQSTGSGTAGASFLVPTTGFSDIVLSLDHRVSGTASRWFQVDYTLNGGSSWVTGYWNNNGAAFDGQFYTYNVDFSSVAGANNNPDFGVRIVSIFALAPFDENLTNSFDANTAYQRGNDGSRTPGNGLTTGTYATSGLWRLDNVTISGNSANPPATQDSDITFSNILTNGFDINWTNGDGAGRIVVLNTANTFTDPVDGTDPVADANYAGGEQVVFNGSGSTVTVTGLNDGTTYWARVYGYDGSCDNTVFNTATATDNPNSGSTTSISPPTKLVVSNVNNGDLLVQDLAFSITVEAQDDDNIPQLVGQDTDVEVTVLTGNGTLGGTVTATILANTSSVTISGLLYDTEDVGVEFQIAVTAGDVLTEAVTAPLDFVSPPQSLSFGTVAAAAVLNEVLPSFTVEAVRSDFTTAAEFTGDITLSIFSGSGNVLGTLTRTAVNGIATFDDISFDAADTYVLEASAIGLDEGFSNNIIITLVPTVTELVVPQFIGSKSAASTNNNRTPIVACVQFDNLIPNTVYKLQAGIGLTTDPATTLGAGNVWDGNAYSGSQIANAFTSDANGSSGAYWVFMESTGNASRFGAGQVHNLRLRFAPQAESFGAAVQFISTSTFTALDIAPTALTPATTDDGAYLLGTTAECMGGNYVLAYDNEAGTGSPLSVFQVRNTIPTSATASQSTNPTTIADVFTQGGASTEGQYALVIPIGANNTNGVRRLELRDAQNALVAAITDADGVWAGGANTTSNARRSVSQIGTGDAILAPDSDGDNIADCEDDCPLAVDGIANFEPSTCACELGYFATITDISGNDVITACTICPPGSFCADGLVAVECPAGRFQDLVGQIACFDCGAGTFSATTGATSCNACPVGTFNAVTGASSCAPCAAGFANASEGQTECSACPAGSFSANSGQVVCDLCPANTFNPNSAQTECLACPNGETSGVGATECEAAGPCNDLTLEFQTDANPGEITWQIRDNNNTVVASGGPLVAPGGIQTEFACLPNGCYTLRVLDSTGDGIANGGYTLRQTGPVSLDSRIIDNFRNFNSGSESAIGNGPSAFCLPISEQKPIFVARDKMDWVSNEFFVCEPDGDVSAQWQVGDQSLSGYQFWFFDPNGSYSFRRGRTHSSSDGFGPASEFRACHMRINNWAVANQIPANVLMNVRIRARVAGVYKEFGPAYRFMIDPVAAACPQTKLNDIPNQPAFSCNSSRNWGAGNFVHARQVSGANRYQFRFRIASEGFVKVVTSNTYFTQLNWAVLPLEPGKTYEVQVRASKDGGATWCASGAVWGPSCTLTINPLAQAGEQNLDLDNSNSGSLALWPNPNQGDQLFLDLSGIKADVRSVSVDIFDLTGKQIAARILPTQGDRLNTVLNLNGDLATGMYLVNITAGDKRYTERLVIAR